MEMDHYVLGNRGIIFPLTLVVHVLLIVISPCHVLWMRITNEQKSATMVTINLKVSMCRDIIANSNITYVFNPYDSCNTDVNTPLNAIHVHVYSDYVISFCKVRCTYIHVVSMHHTIKQLRNDTGLVNDVIKFQSQVSCLHSPVGIALHISTNAVRVQIIVTYRR